MCWKSIVSKLNRCWTKSEASKKCVVLHIPSCGYAGVFPQQVLDLTFLLAKDASFQSAVFLTDRCIQVLPADKKIAACLRLRFRILSFIVLVNIDKYINW
jgi:hypothetical protein